MKIVCWNIRGRGNNGYLFKNQFIHKLANPDILFFVDTRDALGNIRQCGVNYLSDGVCSVNNIGLSGGLALFWETTKVEIKILRSHDRFIHTSILDKHFGNVFLFTFVYGYPNHDRNMHLWNDISDLNDGLYN